MRFCDHSARAHGGGLPRLAARLEPAVRGDRGVIRPPLRPLFKSTRGVGLVNFRESVKNGLGPENAPGAASRADMRYDPLQTNVKPLDFPSNSMAPAAWTCAARE
jgi:hypothetical protein